MEDQQELVRADDYVVNERLVTQIWTNEKKGLKKELISFTFEAMTRANDLAKCLVEISEVDNPKNHSSKLLETENLEGEVWIELCSATTPIDCYIESFLKEMFIGETSKCSITTKSSVITFIIRMKKIEFDGHHFEKTAEEMFNLAKKYKENGVIMFKEHPLFAHNYFNMAAKCLLSYVPFNEIEVELKDSELTREEFESLLENIYLNISACLIKQNRFEEILHVLKFVEDQKEPTSKSIYRLAQAHYQLKNFEKAKELIERVDYKSSKELVQLLGKIQECWKKDNDNYSVMVKKMFA